MPLSGEAIRTMNYVDDISVTLRRILAVLPSLTDEERAARRRPHQARRAQLRIRHHRRHEQQVTQAVPPQAAPAEAPVIRTIAVIGAGTAGRSFALAAACAGFHVVLEDVMPANLRRAEADFSDMTQRTGPYGAAQLPSSSPSKTPSATPTSPSTSSPTSSSPSSRSSA